MSLKMKNKTPRPKIIAISGEARHGKDEFARAVGKILEQKGRTYVKIAYADYVKHIARTVHDWNGKKDEKGRALLQEIGTAARQIDEDFWVSIVEQTISAIYPGVDYVVIPDARYENEINYWKERDYEVTHVRVFRPSFDNGLTAAQKAHASETSLLNVQPDFEVTNITIYGLGCQAETLAYVLGV